jgi:hypothetical protein
MHDPMCVAHEIYLGSKKKKNGHYKSPLLTIWHVDPETDNTDDSCGWFIRSRHINKELLRKVTSEFEFNFKHNYWFNEAGYSVFSVAATTLNMYSAAAWQYFMWTNKGNPSDKARRQYKNFMRKYLYDILSFAENPTDSLHSSITMKYGVEKKEERIRHFVSIVLADVMRKLRPWYKHPRWHIHHWKIQFHPLQQLKRRYWDKCSVCGKRGFKESAIGDWNGTKRWHQACDRNSKVAPIDQNLRDTA